MQWFARGDGGRTSHAHSTEQATVNLETSRSSRLILADTTIFSRWLWWEASSKTPGRDHLIQFANIKGLINSGYVIKNFLPVVLYLKVTWSDLHCLIHIYKAACSLPTYDKWSKCLHLVLKKTKQKERSDH